MKLGMIALVMTTAIGALFSSVEAAPDAATGVWQVYSDKDGAQDGRIRVSLRDGKLVGVVDALRPDVPADSRCTRCSGAQKDQPILGLVVMWGLERDGDSWTGGTILDPQTGSTYSCHAKYVAPDSLEVRGYGGMSVFGRTQTWKRAR